MRIHVNFRFHVVTEYSLAIFVSLIFYLLLFGVSLPSWPQGHPECADCKRIAYQYSYMLSLMLQQIVSDQTHSMWVRPHWGISKTEREKEVEERGRFIRGVEDGGEQKEGQDCYRWSNVSQR